ncbi:MAG: condensation domain-containing protein [Isosphaeraceae bacterium]
MRRIPSRHVSQRLPLTLTEEIFQVIDDPTLPVTQLAELRVKGNLDEDRLRDSIARAIAKHPMTRARLARARCLLSPPQWEMNSPVSPDVLQVIDQDDDEDMATIRSSFCSQPIDLTSAPALRVLLVRRRSGDSLLVSMHHAIADGIGGFRFIESLARAYSGREDPTPSVEMSSARDIRSYLRRADESGREPLKPSTSTPGQVALVAPEGATSAPGYGIGYMTLTQDERKHLDPRRHGSGVTLNDLLISALHMTICCWNAQRNQPCDSILILIPVNTRPIHHAFEMVANLSSVEGNLSTPPDRTSTKTIVSAVSTQTHAASARIRIPEFLLRHDMLWSPTLNLFTYYALYLSRWIHRSEGPPRTTLLTNIGRMERLITSGFGGEAGEITEIWPSAPALMPWGMTMTSGTYRGRVHLSLRYCRKFFSDHAAESFLNLYKTTLFSMNSTWREC